MKYLILLIIYLFVLSSCGHKHKHTSQNEVGGDNRSNLKEVINEVANNGASTNFPTIGFQVVYKDTI